MRSVKFPLEMLKAWRMSVEGKCLTNTPVREVVSVLKLSNDRKNRVVKAQATNTSGSSAVGG